MDKLGSWLGIAAVVIGLFVVGWMLSGGGDNPMGKNKKKKKS
jgi:hypothetical protein